jgi:hypothetical protein
MSVIITNIEKFAEDIRSNLLAILFGDGEDIINVNGSYAAVAHAFDRAHTKAIYANQEPAEQPPAESLHGSLKSPVSGRVTGKGGPKPGSAAARARAQKAQITRAENKRKAQEEAAKAAGAAKPEPAAKETTSNPPNAPARPTGFGGIPQSGVGGGV